MKYHDIHKTLNIVPQHSSIILYRKFYVSMHNIYLDGLDTFSKYFKDNYKCIRFRKRNKVPSLNFPKLYIDLTIAQRSCRQRQEQLSASAEQHFKNNEVLVSFESASQYIPNRHVPLSYKFNSIHWSSSSGITKNISDLFIMPNDTEPKMILVEGIPGIGKTELVKEISLRWADDKILHEIKIMFLLSMRRPEICKVDSVDDFVKCVAKDILVDEQASSLIKQLKISQGKSVMFLIDGFDECSNKLQEDGFVIRLINGEILSYSLILITSRPSATYHLHNQADKIAEILGFAEKEQDLYVSQALEKFPDKQVKLTSYVRENFSIKSYSFIPLYLAMLVSLLNEDCLPETMTEMIGNFILYTIYYHLKTSTIQVSSPMRFHTLHDLPKWVLKIVCQLSSLAFDGIKNRKLVFTLKDVKQTCPEIENVLDGFGLLGTVECYSLDEIGDTSYSFNFLHYTIQEYLAAFYVSTLSDEEQYSIMGLMQSESYVLNDPSSKHKVKRTGFYGVNCFWHSHYSHMWLLYSGITGGNSIAFKRFVHGTDSLGDSFKIPGDVRHLLLLLQYYVEAKNELISNMLLDDGTINISCEDECVFLPHHMLSLVYFLLRSKKTYRNIIFSNFVIPEDSLSILVRYFADFKNIKSICFKANGLLPSSVMAIADIIRVSYLEELEIVENNICKNGITEIATALSVNNRIISLTFSSIRLSDGDASVLMSNFNMRSAIESLDISNNKIGNNGALEVAKFLIRHKTLKILNLSHNLIGFDEASIQLYFSLFFSFACGVNNTNKLKEINFWDCSGVVALAVALNYSPLQSLDLSYNHISLNHHGLHKLACAIEANTTLQSMHLSGNNFNSIEGIMIANALRINNSLILLSISDNEISDFGMYTFCTMLYFNTTIKQLDVSSNDLNLYSAIEIGQVLRQNCVLTTLALGSNNIGDLGSQHLAAALQVNKTITSLYIRDNMIGDVGAEAIAIALKKNVTLVQLDISFNQITDNGAGFIFYALCMNRTLKTLFAFFNPISDLVIEEFLALHPDVIVNKFFVLGQSASDDRHCLQECDIPFSNIQSVGHDRSIIISQGYYHKWRNEVTGEICVEEIYEYLIPQNQKDCLKYYIQKKFGDEPSTTVLQVNFQCKK